MANQDDTFDRFLHSVFDSLRVPEDLELEASSNESPQDVDLQAHDVQPDDLQFIRDITHLPLLSATTPCSAQPSLSTHKSPDLPDFVDWLIDGVTTRVKRFLAEHVPEYALAGAHLSNELAEKATIVTLDLDRDTQPGASCILPPGGAICVQQQALGKGCVYRAWLEPEAFALGVTIRLSIGTRERCLAIARLSRGSPAMLFEGEPLPQEWAELYYRIDVEP